MDNLIIYRWAYMWNPNAIRVKEKEYELTQIYFFNENGIVLKNEPWFGMGVTGYARENDGWTIIEGKDIKNPIMVKRKLKTNWNETDAYIIPKGRRGHKLQAELYIPLNRLEYKLRIFNHVMESPTDYTRYNSYLIKLNSFENGWIRIDKYAGSVKRKDNIEFIDKVNKFFEETGGSISPYRIVENKKIFREWFKKEKLL